MADDQKPERAPSADPGGTPEGGKQGGKTSAERQLTKNGGAPASHSEVAARGAVSRETVASDAVAERGSTRPSEGSGISGGVSAAAAASESRDVALIHGVDESGHLKILRQRDDQLELGVLQPVREGVPIRGELVSLTPRKEFPLLCDVKTEFAPSLPPRTETAATAAQPRPEDTGRSAARRGPAQVATDEYRTNWERIWNKKASTGNLPN